MKRLAMALLVSSLAITGAIAKQTCKERAEGRHWHLIFEQAVGCCAKIAKISASGAYHFERGNSDA